MPNKILLASVLAGALGICAFSTPAQDPDNSDWQTEPALETPSTDGGTLYIGHGWHNKKEGDPNGIGKKKFKCGERAERFCTVKLDIAWVRGNDERLKVSLANAGGTEAKTVYAGKDTASATRDHTTTNEFTLSVKGCEEVEISVTFEKTSASKKKNVQSSARVKIARHYCAQKDETNEEERWVDAEGKKLARPE